MTASLLVLCVLLLTTPGGLGSYDQEADSYQHTICVTNSSTSECCRNDKVCYSFDCIKSSIQNSTFVLFEATNIRLNSSIWFADLYKIAFAGLNSEGTRIICNTSKVANDSGTGLGFVRVRDLKLVGLKFEQCGALHKSTTLNTHTRNSTLNFRSSIYILNSSDITIANVTIEASSGNALTLFDTNGVVTINSSHFLWNRVPESEKESYPGGGGVYIEFTYCSLGLVGQCENIVQRNNGSKYHFQDCTFKNNIATSLNITPVSHHDPVVATNSPYALGKGGGLNIVFRGDATDNNIHIHSCRFLNNTAVWGGGLHIGFENGVWNSTVFVNDSIFEGNVCPEKAGGGADVGYFFLKESNLTTKPSDNAIHFTRCAFRDNEARNGGGVSVYSNKHRKNFKNTITFTNCTWKRNKARFGSAVILKPLTTWDSLGATDGRLPSPVFENSHFISNFGKVTRSYPNHTLVQTRKSRGGFTAVGFTIHFKGELYFENHTNSAIYVNSCILDFDSEANATFIDNSGFAGGAISLIGLSWMYVSDNSSFTFISNTAADRGGAISVSKEDPTCFIMYKGSKKGVTERNLVFRFSGNIVGNGNTGNSIFLTSLQPCQSECRHAGIENSEMPLDCIGNFSYDNKKHYITTEGSDFKLNKNILLPLKVIPGKEFALPFFSEDDLKQRIGSRYSVAVKNVAGSEIRVAEAYSHILHDRLKLYGNTSDKGEVVLSPLRFHGTEISFDVEIHNCPPGFSLLQDNLECKCAKESYVGILRCNDDFQAYIHRGFWIGYVGNSTAEEDLLTGYCPSGFCFNDGEELREIEHLVNAPSKKELDSLVCGKTRTGKLCGDCRGNHSAYFHSRAFRCDTSDNCSMGLLFYAISELLPLTVLFLVVIVFNISFTSGAVNAFIFFAQVIDSLDILAKNFIWFPPWVFSLTRIHRFVYRSFNLDYFSVNPLAFCLWKGAKLVDVIAFKYVTVAYALILVISTIVLMNICNCYRICYCIKPRTVKSSVIHGISAFLVMCYAQSTKASFLLLHPSRLCSKGPEGSSCKDYVVHYHGSTAYFSKDHLPYALPAIFFLVMITVFPTILLLVYPAYYKILALLKLNENRRVQKISRYIPIEKLKPFFDSFQSCYKDNFRFFSGLFFVYRLSILLISSVSKSLDMFYATIEGQLIFMLVIHALAQPYEKRWHNAVDILTFADLAIINGITYFNYIHTKETGFQHRVDMASSIQLLLIYLPMVYLVMYIMFYLVSKIKTHFKRKNESDTIDDFAFPARLIYNDEDSDAEEEEYHHYEEFELQDITY